MKWVYVAVIIISLGIMGYFYVSLNRTSTTPTHAPTNDTSRSVAINDAFKDGEHRLSGQIRLPHSCYNLDTQAIHDVNNPEAITLVFTASDKMLDKTLCAQLPTNYPFQVLADGIVNATITATLNNEILPIEVTRSEWQASTGTYFNKIEK